MLELWIFFALNNPFFMVPEGSGHNQQNKAGKISIDEARELNVVL
jgi:hypothetical protein